VGLPPTPEELGLADEAYDIHIDNLPLWERNKVLEEDRPKKEWSQKEYRTWWIWFTVSLVWAIITTPFVVISFIIPPIGFVMWIIGFAPLVSCIRRRVEMTFEA